MGHGIFFDGRLQHFVAAPGRLVGGGDHSYYIEPVADKRVEAFDGKLGSPEKHYF